MQGPVVKLVAVEWRKKSYHLNTGWGNVVIDATNCFLLRGENYFYKRGLGIKKETLARLVRAFFIAKKSCPKNSLSKNFSLSKTPYPIWLPQIAYII